jgi:hypothetical protein
MQQRVRPGISDNEHVAEQDGDGAQALFEGAYLLGIGRITATHRGSHLLICQQ